MFRRAADARQDDAIEFAKGQLAKLTLGDPFDKTTRLGPLASAGQRESVLGYIEKGKQEGATLVDLHLNDSQITQHPEWISADGFHPSRQGYAVIAKQFEDAYRRIS